MEKRLNLGLVVLSGASLMALFLDAGCMQGPETKIQMVSASYGYVRDRKDVKDDFAKSCDGRSSCTVNVGNEGFTLHPPADPSPGNDKDVIYSWKCGEAVHKDAAAEGRKARLTCG